MEDQFKHYYETDGTILQVGLPDGSLNNPERANPATHIILEKAGFLMSGYSSGKETKFPICIRAPWFQGHVIRPQAMIGKLKSGVIDMAIVGKDHYLDSRLQGNNNIIDLGDLEYGVVKLGFEVKDTLHGNIRTLDGFINKWFNEDQEIICYTEYPNLAKEKIMQSKSYKKLYGERAPVFDFKGAQFSGINDNNTINDKIKIIYSHGKTERQIEDEYEIVLDNIQTGKTMKDNHLKVLPYNGKTVYVMDSSVHAYIKKDIKPKIKKQMAEFVVEQMYGVIKAQNYREIKMNVKKNQVDAVVNLLIENNCCLREPTVIHGKNFSQVDVVVLENKWLETSRNLKGAASGVIVSKIEQVLY